MKKIYLSIVLSCCFLSCKKDIDLQGFDLETWKKDTKGCQNQRMKLLAEFEQKVKPQLKGISEKSVAALLGKADMQELSRRNQKFYYYYLEAGTQCKDSTNNQTAKRLQIRFDAINNVNEIVVVYN